MKGTHIYSLMQITTCNYVFSATTEEEKSKILAAVKSVWMPLIHLLQLCRWLQWAVDDVFHLICFHAVTSYAIQLQNSAQFLHLHEFG